MGYEEFEAYLNRKKNKPRTIITYLYGLKLVEKFLGKLLDKTTTRKDIEGYLNSISDRSSNTMIIRLQALKVYFRWLYEIKKKGIYPDVVDIPYPAKRLNNLISEDMLTEEDILKMISCSDNLRDQAIISLLFDSAIRRGELISSNIEDVKINGETGLIEVDGKTGRRSVPLSKSIPYLRDWINCHPLKDKPDSPLFCSLKGNVGHRLNQETVKYAILKARKRAGIKKRVFIHLFRHSRLTQLDKRGVSHTAMKYFAGWSRNSNMPSVYSHFSAQDTSAAIFQADGIVKKVEEEEKSFLEPVKCYNCKSLQNPSNVYCSVCNTPLNEKAKEELEAKKEFMELIFRKDVWAFLQSKMKK